MRDKMIAVIGAGYWGKNLVRNFMELEVLLTVCDTNTESVKDLLINHRHVELTSQFEKCLIDKNILAVAIATPAEFHYKMAKEALIAGKDVFVEKPLSLNIGEAEDLVRLAEEKKRVLMVDHILQYHPAILRLKELIDGGRLGKLQYIYSNRLNIGKLRREENILWSFAPHDISAILYLTEEFPLKVRAFGEAYLQQNIYDTTITDLTFHDKLKAHIFVSWLHPFKEQKLVVIGDKNMAVFDDVAEKKLILYPHKVEWIHRNPVASREQAEVVAVETKEPLKEACMHFLDCVNKRSRPRTDGNEGLAVLKVLDAAQNYLDRGD